jgi:polyribonucleotide nucleotidyltransferase
VLQEDRRGHPQAGALAGKPKFQYTPHTLDQELYKKIEGRHSRELTDALNTEKHSKEESHTLVSALKKKTLAELPEEQQAEGVASASKRCASASSATRC